MDDDLFSQRSDSSGLNDRERTNLKQAGNLFRNYGTPVNAIIRQLRLDAHHPVFSPPFHPWEGEWDLDSNIITDFMGAHWNVSMFCNWDYKGQKISHALRSDLCLLWDWKQHTRERACSKFDSERKKIECLTSMKLQQIQLPWPVVGEEYFEYIDVLTSIVEHRRYYSNKKFTFVEIGAGYGHWTITAAKALSQATQNSERMRGMIVEFDATKKPGILEALMMNRLNTDDIQVKKIRMFK